MIKDAPFSFDIASIQPPTVAVALPDMSAHLEEISESIQANKEELIRRQAEANAEAYVAALKSSPFIFDEIIGALASLCGNRHYNSTTDEDTMNDFVRDILGQGLQVRDQTRQGISGRSRTAEKGRSGEVDIQVRNNGRPIGIYEGLKLSGINTQSLHEHIKKATVNYNPQGVKDVFVVAYVVKQSNGFGVYWNKFIDCVKEYNPNEPEYNITWDDTEEDTGLSAVRSIHGVYNMDGVEHNVHVIAVKIME